MIPITFMTTSKENLPDATFVTPPVGSTKFASLRARRRSNLIRGTAPIQDACMEALKTIIKPGMRDHGSLCRDPLLPGQHGSERGLVQVGSGPLGHLGARSTFRISRTGPSRKATRLPF